MLLRRYLKDVNRDVPPATLQELHRKSRNARAEMQKQNGAVAIKFEAAYLRSLDFGPDEPIQLVQQIYAHFIKGDVPLAHDYTRLQNFLFHYIAREAGRLGLPVHIHTGGGCGSYFMLMGSNPALLESVLNDASLRNTNFVLVHAGAGAFTKYANYLLMKPNVYADFSEQTWLISTRRLSDTIRDLLEWYPEKVMFGTDLYPNTPEMNWEEIGWQATQSSREALAIALTGMMQDGQITRERALELAHMALHDNAAKLYGWSQASNNFSETCFWLRGTFTFLASPLHTLIRLKIRHLGLQILMCFRQLTLDLDKRHCKTQHVHRTFPRRSGFI